MHKYRTYIGLQASGLEPFFMRMHHNGDRHLCDGA